jgi:hypothetical protein
MPYSIKRKGRLAKVCKTGTKQCFSKAWIPLARAKRQLRHIEAAEKKK